MFEVLEFKFFWLLLIVSLIYIYLKYYVFNYWKKHDIPHEDPGIILGNIPFSHFLGRISLGNFLKNSYEKFCQYPYHGYYAFYQPVLMVNDPELIRTVLVKEFSHFPNRGGFNNNDDVDSISGHLFLLSGEKWKRLRHKFSPMFSSGKLKQMYSFITDVSNCMVGVCDSQLKESEVVEIRELMARYTTDIITSVVYGIDGNSLRTPNSEIYYYGSKLFDFGRLIILICTFIPKILEKCYLPINKNDVQEFFMKIFKDSLEQRRKEKVIRKDFLNLLIQLLDHGELEDDDEGKIISTSERNKEDNQEKLKLNEAAAQAFVFFAAGYETSSSTATYCLYELALHQEIQDKLRKEIDDVYNTTGMTYDNLMGMEYLEMVFSETLRKHPSIPFLNRICVEDFTIPGSDYTVPKGMPILVSVSGIHNNPEYFPNPEVFDPERFTRENIASRNNYVSLGFGEGPRYCIGKRFGQMQTKQAIVAMVRNYKLDICDKTEIPVEYTSRTFVQTPRDGVHLRLQKRNL